MPSAKPLCTSAALSLLLLSARFHEGVSPRHFDDCGHFIGVLCWQSQCKCQCQPVAVAGWRGCGGVGEGWPFGCGRAWRTGGSPLFLSSLSLSTLVLGSLFLSARSFVACRAAGGAMQPCKSAFSEHRRNWNRTRGALCWRLKLSVLGLVSNEASRENRHNQPKR